MFVIAPLLYDLRIETDDWEGLSNKYKTGVSIKRTMAEISRMFGSRKVLFAVNESTF